MKKILILLCLATAGRSLSASVPATPGCDTLITVKGLAYVVRIKSETTREIQFSLCDDSLAVTYAARWSNIRQIRRAGTQTAGLGGVPAISPSPPPASWIREDRSIPDSCDRITFTDGKTLSVRIVDQDMFNYFYTLCDRPEDRTYMVPNRRIRSVSRAAAREKKKRNPGLGCLIALLVAPVALLIVALLAAVIGG